MRLSPDGSAIYVLLAQPNKVVRIALDRFQPDWELPLPMSAVDFDLGAYFDPRTAAPRQVGAVSYGAAGKFAFFDPAARKVFPPTQLDGEVGSVRFQYGNERDNILIAANLSGRSLSVYNSARRQRIVELPLTNRPDHLCFSADRGQLFVTGQGSDAVSVVYPYLTPEVAETVLAGRQPGAMAASSDPYLFIANPSSGDVSILNADHKVIAVVSVGAEPCFIATTPNSEFALVLNRKSGDMAVLRIGTIKGSRRLKSASLFTMIPVGSAPVSVAVRMI
jgi:YVTN family beta-propeller protein